MNTDDGLVIAGISKGSGQQLSESFLLLFGRQRCLAAKHFFHQDWLKRFGILRIIEHTVQVGVAVVESGEKKAGYGHLDDPVPDAVFDAVLLCIVAQPCFGQFYRADAAEQIFVCIVRGIKHF